MTGLKRRGYTDEQLKEIKTAYKALFLKKGHNLSDALETLSKAKGLAAVVRDYVAQSERGVTR